MNKICYHNLCLFWGWRATHGCLHGCVSIWENQRSISSIFLHCSLPFFFFLRKGFSLRRLEPPPGNLLSPSAQHWGYWHVLPHQAFCVGAWDTNSVPQDSMADILPTEPFLVTHGWLVVLTFIWANTKIQAIYAPHGQVLLVTTAADQCLVGSFNF